MVEAYAELMRNGVQMEAVTIYKTPLGLLLVDGWHRLEATLKNGGSKILAFIHEGTYIQAADASLKANIMHGCQRSAPQKKNYVIFAIKIHPDWTNRRIADFIQVSHTLVNEAEADSDIKRPEERIGSDGKVHGKVKLEDVYDKHASTEPDADTDPTEEPEKPHVTAGIPPAESKGSKVAQNPFKSDKKPAPVPTAPAAMNAAETAAWAAISPHVDPQLHRVMRSDLNGVRKLAGAKLKPGQVAEVAVLVWGQKWKMNPAVLAVTKEIGADTRLKELMNRCIAAGGRFEATLNGYTIIVSKP